jgi:hypothetical protein
MPAVVLCLPIPNEKFDAWRAAVAEIAGPRRAAMDAARRRQGVSRVSVWVQREPGGAREIVLLEMADPERGFAEMAKSEDPFDVWFRQMLMDVYQLDLTAPPGPLPEQLLDWSATSS